LNDVFPYEMSDRSDDSEPLNSIKIRKTTPVLKRRDKGDDILRYDILRDVSYGDIEMIPEKITYSYRNIGSIDVLD
jgi:hypothetical protein